MIYESEKIHGYLWMTRHQLLAFNRGCFSCVVTHDFCVRVYSPPVTYAS